MKFHQIVNLLLVLTVVGSEATLLGEKKCTYGPSHWCQTLKNAKNCSAVDSCIHLQWQTKEIPKNSGDLAPTCGVSQLILRSLQSKVKHSNPKFEDLQAFIRLGCSEMNKYDVRFKLVCQDIAEKYLKEVNRLIQSGIDTRVISHLLEHCSEKSASHMEKTIKAQIRPLMKKNQNKECQKCTKEVARIRQSKNMKDELKKYMMGKICTSQTDQCQYFVEMAISSLIPLFNSEMTDRELCKFMNECPTKLSPATLVAISKHASRLTGWKTFWKKVECYACEAIIYDLRGVLEENQTEAALRDFMLNKVCPKMGVLKDDCTNGINDYEHPLYELMLKELQPTKVCRLLSACTSDQKSLSLPRHFKQRRIMAHDYILQLHKGFLKTEVKSVVKGAECFVCKHVCNYMYSLLTKNSTEYKIEKLLEKICGYLPTKDVTTCDKIVEENTPKLIQLLKLEVPSELICYEIGVCTAKKAKVKSLFKPIVTSPVPFNIINCAHGPKVYCRHRQLAKSCGKFAVRVCEKYYWK